MNPVANYLSQLHETMRLLPEQEILNVIDLLHQARLEQRQIFVMGNGGSASTATHMVCDLGKNTRHPAIPNFRVIGLADNMAIFSAEMALARAKRLVEGSRHVAILLDSITRLGRAYNLVVPPSGRTLSGGLDPAALYPPKHFFGAARNIEEGGSLTIIATCLVDTGSRLDDVVYEEFKGTGNMELHLSRKLQERRLFPAVDIERSSTRREDLLLGPDLLQRVWLMRRMYIQMTTQQPQGAGMDPAVATEAIITRLDRARNNQEFLENLGRDD